MQPILICGLHRCGTSYLAHCFHESGVPMMRKGAVPTVHFEDVFLLQANIQAMQQVGLDLMEPPRDFGDTYPDSFYAALTGYRMQREREGIRPWGVKAPRIGHLAPAYVQTFHNAKFVICVRNLVHAGKSWHERGHGKTVAEAVAALAHQLAFLLDFLPSDRTHIWNYDGDPLLERRMLSEFVGREIDTYRNWQHSGRK